MTKSTKPRMSAQALNFLSAQPNPPEIAVGPQVEPTESVQAPAASPEKLEKPQKSAKAPQGGSKLPTAEERLAQLQAEMEALQKAAREEQIRKAKYPWQNPEVVQNQARLGYNMKLDPELYLKIQWLMEHRGGIKSIQVFLDRAAKKMAQEMLEELGAV